MGARKFYVWREGKLIEMNKETYEAPPFIHQDSMPALRHPATNEMIDSRSKWERINKEKGLVCVGNDLLSKRPDTRRDVLTENKILDAIHRAEAIVEDPTKWRAAQNRNNEANYRRERLLNGDR